MSTFSWHLSANLVLAEGGDRVAANERRQAIWHTLCRCRHVTISYWAAEYKISRTTIGKDMLFHVLMSISIFTIVSSKWGRIEVSYDNDSTRRTDLRKSCTHAWRAAAFSNIGINKLREITNERNCDFVFFVGNKRLIKRKRFEQYLDRVFSL